MFSRMMITTKMLVASILTLIVVLAAGITFIGWQSSSITKETTFREAKAVTETQVAEVKNTLQYGLTSAGNIANALTSLKQDDMTNRQAWSGMLLHMLEKTPELSGTWGAVIDNKLDGEDTKAANSEYHDASGVWRPYFFRNPDGSIGFRTIADMDSKSREELSWFYGAYDSGKPYATEPYSWDMGGKTVTGVSLAVPIKDASDNIIGVAGTDIILTELSDYLSSIKPLGSGTVQLISQEGKWIAHSDSTLLGKNWNEGRSEADLSHQAELFNAIKSGKPLTFEGYSNTLATDVIRFIDPVPVGNTGNSLALIVSIPVDSVYAASRQITMSVVITGLVLILAVSLALFLVGQSVIRKPLAATTETIKALINRQYDVTIGYLNRKDEIGQINHALEIFRESSLRAEQLTKEQEKEKEEQLRRAAKVNELAQAFDAQISGLLDTVSSSVERLDLTSQQLTQGADSTSMRSNAVAAASEEASANVEAVASAAEELFASVNEINRQVDQSNQNCVRGGDAGQSHQQQDRRPFQRGNPHRRGGQADHGCGRTDQPARTQRDHRGRTRWRSWQGLCGCRRRGQRPCGADLQGNGRDRTADSSGSERNRWSGYRYRRNLGHHRTYEPDCRCHHRSGAAARASHAGNRTQHSGSLRRHAGSFFQHFRRLHLG